jgi:hypothetical protein
MSPTVQRFSQFQKVVSLIDGATVSINCDLVDLGILTSLSQTSVFANPTGTPTNGQLLQIRITSASSQAISFGTDYQAASSLILPTATTGGGAEDYIAFRWNATDSKWDMIGATIGQLAAVADGSITAPKLSGAQTGSAPIFGVRAWVNFNGTGTVTINGSGNVSSITDNGTGDYTINFTTALPSANYSAFGILRSDGGSNGNIQISTTAAPTASALRIVCVYQVTPAVFDSPLVCVAVVG